MENILGAQTTGSRRPFPYTMPANVRASVSPQKISKPIDDDDELNDDDFILAYDRAMTQATAPNVEEATVSELMNENDATDRRGEENQLNALKGKVFEYEKDVEMLRQDMSQREKRAREREAATQAKYREEVDQLCRGMAERDRNIEKLKAMLQFETREKEMAVQKTKQIEKERRISTNSNPSQNGRRKIVVGVGTRNGDARKASSFSSQGVQCELSDYTKRGLSPRLSPLLHRFDDENLATKLVMSPPSEVFSLLRLPYKAKCAGTVFSLKFPAPVETKRILSFSTAAAAAAAANSLDETSVDFETQSFRAHVILNQIRDESVESFDGTGTELRLLPFIEKCVAGYLSGATTQSSSESTASASKSTLTLSDEGEFVDESLVCLLNSLLVLKTLVLYSEATRKVLVGSAAASDGTPSAEFFGRKGMEKNVFAPKNCSTPQQTAMEFVVNGQELEPHPLLGGTRFLCAKPKGSCQVVLPDVLTPTGSVNLGGNGHSLERLGSCLSSLCTDKGRRSYHESSEIETASAALMSHLIDLASSKQDEILEVQLAVPLLCLEILDQLTCVKKDLERFVPLIREGIFVSCLCTGHNLLQSAVLLMLYHLVESSAVVASLCSEPDSPTLLKVLQLMELREEENVLPLLELKIKVIHVLTGLWTLASSLTVQLSSSAASKMVRSLVLALHRELMALMPCWHPSFSCQSDLDKTRLLFLQEGSSLLCLIWCRDSSFGKYHAGMAQYVHVVCDLHKLFQAMLKEGMTTKLHVANMQELLELGEFSQKE